MARISWEQTVYKKPAVESYQTANMDVDGEKDSELVTSSENELLFKRVVSWHFQTSCQSVNHIELDLVFYKIKKSLYTTEYELN